MTPRWRKESRANPSLDPKCPASWENTGNFVDSGLHGASKAAKNGATSVSYGPIPYASEQGIFCGPCREFKTAIREIFALIRESRSRPLFWAFFAPADKSDRSDRSRTRGRLCPCEASSCTRKSLAEFVDGNDRRSGLYNGEMGRVARAGAPSSP
jgi:hypothetical protein